MDGKVRIMNFGVKGQTSEARQVMEECTQNGYWLLLQNYHLAEEPERGFFNFLKVHFSSSLNHMYMSVTIEVTILCPVTNVEATYSVTLVPSQMWK